MNQLNVAVSRILVDITVNDVPALLADTDRLPRLVRLALVSVRKTKLLAVTAVVEIVAVPATSVPVPAEALVPVVMLILLPAVFSVRLPAAPIFPVVVIASPVPALSTFKVGWVLVA